MKLYAKVTSERASKGQGGNQKLDIDIHIHNRNIPRYNLKIDQESLIFSEKGYNEPLLERNHSEITQKTKGKSQKSECKHFIVRDDYGKDYCQECGQYNNLQ